VLLPSLATPPLFARLAAAQRVLIAGAGGGFDVYAGLPLAIALWDAGVDVHLANLSFAQLEVLDLDAWAAENVAGGMRQVAARIGAFRTETAPRPPRAFPH
jgi:hypothetical protein